MKKKMTFGYLCLNIMMIILSLSCILPVIILISISISQEELIATLGYSLFPRGVDFTAYAYIFENPKMIVDAYGVTIFSSVVGTVLSVFIMSMAAYSLSRNSFKMRKALNFYFYFTMLFSGGLVPTYIFNTQYYHLGDTLWIYIIPSLVNVWYMFLIRTFFKGIPDALVESAYLDGAGEFKIYYSIMLPLSKPVIATVSLFTVLNKWNDWNTSLLYINNERLVTLQYLLQKILKNLQLLKENMLNMPASAIESMTAEMPTETLRMAMAVVAAGPMLFVFPLFQKYFVRGLTVGSVKG